LQNDLEPFKADIFIINRKKMKLFSITYDLRQPGRKYNELYDAIKDLAGPGNWQHPMESFWMVAFPQYSDDIANMLYSNLRPYIDDNDSLFISAFEQNNNQGWMPKSFWQWITDKVNKL